LQEGSTGRQEAALADSDKDLRQQLLDTPVPGHRRTYGAGLRVAGGTDPADVVRGELLGRDIMLDPIPNIIPISRPWAARET